MKLPGRAWLEFEVGPDGDGTMIRQTAVFDPIGLLGLLYWYAVYPWHGRVFAGMLRGAALHAVELHDGKLPLRSCPSAANPASLPRTRGGD
jgi:hypothetical protein